MKVVGEHLPQRQRGIRGVDWKGVCTFVEEQKGAWVEVGVFDPSVASHIRQGKWPSVDPAKFEVATQKAENSERGTARATLFMRLRPVES